MSFTEFCCRAGGSNLNAGTLDGGPTEVSTTPFATYVSGSWDGVDRFLCATENPSSGGVVAGYFVGISLNTTTTFASGLYRIASVTSNSIIVDVTTSGAIARMPSGNGIHTCRVGGAWSGPSGAVNVNLGAYPFLAVSNRMRMTGFSPPRINVKNDQTYNWTSAMSLALPGPIQYRGYQNTYGDDGRFTIQGPVAGGAVALLTIGSAAIYSTLWNVNIFNNGATSSASILTFNNTYCQNGNILVSGSRGIGITLGGAYASIDNFEIVDCNKNNTANTPPLSLNSTNNYAANGLIHHSSGSNTMGIRSSDSASTLENLVVAFNSGEGIFVNSSSLNGGVRIINCDIYGNGRNGIYVSGNNAGLQQIYYKNVNFLDNGMYGIFMDGSGVKNGYIDNCGFGSGIYGNVSGTIRIVNPSGSVIETNTIIYPINTQIYLSPESGNFTLLNLAQLQYSAAFLARSPLFSGTLGSYYRGAAPPLNLTDEQIAEGVWTYPNRTTT